MVKIFRYNHDGVKDRDVPQVLIDSIVDRIEETIFEEMPKQKDVIRTLRDAGWDEKVAIGKHCRHSIDGILEEVGVCVYFGHSQGAFQKLLSLQSLFEDEQMYRCYYITQSSTMAVPSKLVNPAAKPGTNGNRITYETCYRAWITTPGSSQSLLQLASSFRGELPHSILNDACVPHSPAPSCSLNIISVFQLASSISSRDSWSSKSLKSSRRISLSLLFVWQFFDLSKSSFSAAHSIRAG